MLKKISKIRDRISKHRKFFPDLTCFKNFLATVLFKSYIWESEPEKERTISQSLTIREIVTSIFLNNHPGKSTTELERAEVYNGSIKISNDDWDNHIGLHYEDGALRIYYRMLSFWSKYAFFPSALNYLIFLEIRGSYFSNFFSYCSESFFSLLENGSTQTIDHGKWD